MKKVPWRWPRVPFVAARWLLRKTVLAVLLAPVGERFGDAVFRVDTKGCGIDGGGSAFAIDATHLVTNWHVVMNDTDPGLVNRDGDESHGG